MVKLKFLNIGSICCLPIGSKRKYDIVVFGASGFTGQFMVEELARTVDDEHLKWAIAGRDMRKLQAVLSTASQVTGIMAW